MAATEGLVPGHHLRTYDGERAECECGVEIHWKGYPEEHVWHLLDVAFEDGIAAARRKDQPSLATGRRYVTDDPESGRYCTVEMVEVSTTGRVHDVIEAERQAYDEDADRAHWASCQARRGEIQRQGEARSNPRPSTPRRVLVEIHRRERSGDGR